VAWPLTYEKGRSPTAPTGIGTLFGITGTNAKQAKKIRVAC